MIIDSVRNMARYEPVLKNLSAGLSSLASLGDHPQAGRYEFDGGYFMIQEGATKSMEEGDFEAHRKYVDVQIILDGMETVGWADASALKESEAYNDAKDKIMYSGEPMQCNVISAGMFWAAFPDDAHKACRHVTEQTTYKKVVMKLPAD